MQYTPAPVDTSKIELSEELIQLRERLAKNAHDLWAGQRFSDGWTHGPRRDDAKKQNPCLVPYEDLPESEKQYDRLIAMETLKTIIALGFRIISPSIAHPESTCEPRR